MSTELVREMIAALLPVFDKLVAENAGPLGRMAWKILRPLLLDDVAIAKAASAAPVPMEGRTI